MPSAVSHAEQINRVCAWLLFGLSVATLLWSVLQLAGVVWLRQADLPVWGQASRATACLPGWSSMHWP